MDLSELGGSNDEQEYHDDRVNIGEEILSDPAIVCFCRTSCVRDPSQDKRYKGNRQQDDVSVLFDKMKRKIWTKK